PRTSQPAAGAAAAKPSNRYGGDNQRAVSAQLARPTAVAVDSHGTPYIADYGNQRIRKVMDGVITTVAGGGKEPLGDDVLGVSVASGSLGLASTVAVDSHDQLYLLTSREQDLEVWRIDANGFMHSIVSVGPSNISSGQFAPNLPVGGLAITKDGVFFIADRAGDRVI